MSTNQDRNRKHCVEAESAEAPGIGHIYLRIRSLNATSRGASKFRMQKAIALLSDTNRAVPCEEDKGSKTSRKRLSGDHAHSPRPSALSDQDQYLGHRDAYALRW